MKTDSELKNIRIVLQDGTDLGQKEIILFNKDHGRFFQNGKKYEVHVYRLTPNVAIILSEENIPGYNLIKNPTGQ